MGDAFPRRCFDFALELLRLVCSRIPLPIACVAHVARQPRSKKRFHAFIMRQRIQKIFAARVHTAGVCTKRILPAAMLTSSARDSHRNQKALSPVQECRVRNSGEPE